MIAVEQQARERLERLSALRKIKPVDMTTLSQQVTHIRFSLSKTKYFLMDLYFHYKNTKTFALKF